jgi:hypothetical protein
MTAIASSTRLTFFIDLNTVTNGDRVSALLRHSPDQIAVQLFTPVAGDSVTVRDDDLGRGVATVMGIDGDILDLRIDWSTWETRQPFQRFYGGETPWCDSNTPLTSSQEIVV